MAVCGLVGRCAGLVGGGCGWLLVAVACFVVVGFRGCVGSAVCVVGGMALRVVVGVCCRGVGVAARGLGELFACLCSVSVSVWDFGDDAGPATKAKATRWWVLRSATKAYAIRWWTRVATKAEATR